MSSKMRRTAPVMALVGLLSWGLAAVAGCGDTYSNAYLDNVNEIDSGRDADGTAEAVDGDGGGDDADVGVDSAPEVSPDTGGDAALDGDAPSETADGTADTDGGADAADAADAVDAVDATDVIDAADAADAAEVGDAGADASGDVPADVATDGPPPAAVCGNGTPEPGEACDDGNDMTEAPPDMSTLPAGACISDCSIAMKTCGDGTPDPATGEQCDDGNGEDIDSCTSSCISSDDNIGDACYAEGVGQDDTDFTAGTIVGCDNVPATFGGCVRGCLRSIDPGFSQPLVYNPGGYCTLLAISCSGALCGLVPQPGDYATCTACPDGHSLEETTTNAPGGLTINTRSCLKTCTTQADCRWRQWDARFDEWGQYACLPSPTNPGLNICQDVRQYAGN